MFNKVISIGIGKTDSSIIQLFRYTIVGGIAFLVDYFTLYVLTRYFGIFYLVSTSLSFLLGLMVNYALSIVWVFGRRSIENKTKEFAIFLLIGLVGLLFNDLFMWLLTGSLGLYYMLSKAISAVIVYAWNFVARKVILFNGKRAS